mmetsp:Transcript_18186/g.22606  ORF Transcript_18186/g.22606 Transcript_18186/m.22606 type:complete len:205 (+) Transcript_18186:563-1177(+)
MVDGLVIKVLGRDHWLDYMFHEICGYLLVCHFFGMLRRNNNCVYSYRNRNAILKFVLASDLSLSVGTNPVAGTVLANFGKLASDFSRKLVRKRHQRLSLIRCVTKHDTLVTSTNIFDFHRVDGLSNIGTLLFDGYNDIACLVVEALRGIIITNVFDSITNYLLIVHSGGGCDFTENHNHASFTARLASDAANLVTGDASIKNGI